MNVECLMRVYVFTFNWFARLSHFSLFNAIYFCVLCTMHFFVSFGSALFCDASGNGEILLVAWNAFVSYFHLFVSVCGQYTVYICTLQLYSISISISRAMVLRIVQTFSTFSHVHANQRTKNMFHFVIFNIQPKTSRQILSSPTEEQIGKKIRRKDIFCWFEERLVSHSPQLTLSIPITHEFTLQTLLVCRFMRAPNSYIWNLNTFVPGLELHVSMEWWSRLVFYTCKE